ncbi:MAG: 2-dehydropantoate 2-reductase, partial [Chloroflexi bacterium]|nr:2-dehydropantoate 2-reductase [Chloroflexota bacterium]
MNLLVMGAGAVGSVMGGLLAQDGHTVTLVGRPGHMAAIRAGGLRIGGIWGEHCVTDALTCSDALHVPPLPYDAVLLCVKSFDTLTALTEVLPVLSSDTLVVSLQNGLGNWETIAALAGAERTAGGRVIFGADLVADGAVEVTVFGGPVLLGYPDG